VLISSKYVRIGQAEADNVRHCLEAEELTGNGPEVLRYEAALCAEFESPHAIACSSGTAAIYIALAALGVGAGDEVILPPTAPAMTALPVVALGAAVRFADTLPGAFGLDPGDLADKISTRTKAVIEVPMWGYGGDLEPVRGVCRSAAVELIEDAAQAHGSYVGGRPVGARTTIGAFSTHARKLITTGEGGFLLVQDRDLAVAAQRLRGFGQSAGGGESFGDRFGLNFKLSSILASVGRAQVARLRERVAARNVIASQWLGELAGITGLRLVDRPEVHNCYGLAVRVPEQARDAIDKALAAAGLITDTHAYRYRPLNEAPLFKSTKNCQHAVEFIDELIVLPCHEGVTAKMIETACGILASGGA
jgi:perosamine synthetase